MSEKDFEKETLLGAGTASTGNVKMDAGGRKTEDRGQKSEISLGDRDTQGPGGSTLGRIDQYALLRELGGGGFGVVCLARDTVAGVDVAVKGLPPLVKNNADELERIRENFALVSKLHHPNIAAALVLHPAVHVSYSDDQVRQALRVQSGDTLMVMAYAPGVTLSKWRRQFPEGKVPVSQALEVCRQIAEALDYAHGEKVVHRDVKPSNVMVETRGQRTEVGGQRGTPAEDLRSPASDLCVRVLDFGLAAEIRSSMSRVSQEKGDTSGTRPYMAPEQWSGRRQDGRTDQYALAVLFYELVSGAVPFASAFDTGDPVIMANAAENKLAEPLPELSKARNAALMRGLSKDPAQRFATCGELVAALEGSVKDGRKPRISRMARMALAAAVLASGAYLSYASYTAHSARRASERAAAEQAAKADELRIAKEKADAEVARLAKEKADADAARQVKEKLEAEAARQSTEKKAQEEQRKAEIEQQRLAAEKNAKVKGPVEGAAWTSPATGMEFVWVSALNMWAGKYEVTNAEYRKKEPGHDSKEFEGQSLNGDRQPAVYVNFDDAKAYAAWLTECDKGQLGGLRYRVISEAEWQACARCGDGREYPWGDVLPPKYGNYSDSASAANNKIDGYTDGFAVTCPVERSGANEWGLYGLGGNVWEGCASDASGSAFGAWRGASWYYYPPNYLRCAYRLDVGGSNRLNYFGFRLVLSR